MGKKRVAKKLGESGSVAGKTLKVKSRPQKGIAHVYSSYNNTLITLTNEQGDKLISSSAGAAGFSGSKKGTPYAASRAAALVADVAKSGGMKEIAFRIKGVGSGRESAIRTFLSKGFVVDSIKDVTPLPHGFMKSPKPRRV
jgi:small subunit ribosomal protein S11